MPTITSVTLGLVAAAALAPAADAAGCSRHDGSTPPACFASRLKGSFSGHDQDFTWSGTATLTHRVEQTTIQYSGRATITWKLRKPDIGNGCMLTPDHGSFVKHIDIQLTRTPDPRRGWNYAWGGNPQGDTGPQSSVCDGERSSDGDGVINGVFSIGGYTTSLNRIAGTGHETGDLDRWRFTRR